MFSATLPLFKFSPDNSNAYPTFNKATYQHYLNPTSIAKAGSISREDIKRGDRENRRRGVEEGFIHMLHLMRARSSWKQGLGLGLLHDKREMLSCSREERSFMNRESTPNRKQN